MNTSACSLFEGDYQRGLGVLLNSLYSNGFKGKFWVGHRGDLPRWANPIKQCDGFTEFLLADGISVRFVKLLTDAHFTNYKPDFMIQVLNSLDQHCDALFYLDPDVVVNAKWINFQDWVSCGVALCEDIASPIPNSHPWRVGWRRTFEKSGIILKPRDDCYANGGFVGLTRSHMDFLFIWKRIQDLIWDILGGSQFTHVAGGKKIELQNGMFSCFSRADQDALNAAIEAANDIPISFVGQKAMVGLGEESILPHAIQSKKPWRRNYLLDALKGSPPLFVDKVFWNYTQKPLVVYSRKEILINKLSIIAASFAGRFYSRK